MRTSMIVSHWPPALKWLSEVNSPGSYVSLKSQESLFASISVRGEVVDMLKHSSASIPEIDCDALLFALSSREADLEAARPGYRKS